MNKRQQLVKKCIESMEMAEGILECPICFNNSKKFVQCLTGHHVCADCKKQLTKCPLCERDFNGTKPFIIEDLSDALSFLKLSLSDLDEDAKKPIKDTASIEAYRKLVKAVLFEFSNFCHKNNTFLLFLNKYIENPAVHRNEMERQLISLTSELRNLTRSINEKEETLTTLKKSNL